MSSIEDTTANTVAQTIANGPLASTRHKTHQSSLLRFVWWTVPIHATLGFAFWWMMTNAPDELGTALLWIHVGFPALLVISIRLWWNRWGELLALLAINHAATFAVLIFMPWS